MLRSSAYILTGGAVRFVLFLSDAVLNELFAITFCLNIDSTSWLDIGNDNFNSSVASASRIYSEKDFIFQTETPRQQHLSLSSGVFLRTGKYD